MRQHAAPHDSQPGHCDPTTPMADGRSTSTPPCSQATTISVGNSPISTRSSRRTGSWWRRSQRRPKTSFALVSMFSLEPFTIEDLGSPQVFQTGETFNGAPLIDYQHPHDLIMALGGRVERTMGSVRGTFEASLVGAPAPGTAAVHASRVGRGQSPGAARPSRPRLHAHLERRPDRRRVVAWSRAGRVLVPRPRARRRSPGPRSRRARFVGGARVVDDRGRGVCRRPAAA